MYYCNKTSALILCLTLFAWSGFAQFKKERNLFRVGIRHVDVTTPNTIGFERRIAPVIDLGFGASYRLSDNIKFEPEIHYTPRGFRTYSKFTDSTNASYSLFLHYLDFQPNISFLIGANKNKGKQVPLHLWVGPYIGYAFAGNANAEELAINPRTKRADTTLIASADPFAQGIKRLDYGINIGIGLRFEKFINFGITYSRGFNDLADNRIYGTDGVYHQSYGFYLSVLFDDIF